MKRFIVLCFIVSCGCTPAMQRQPIVYGEVAGQNREYDIIACERFAENSTATDPSVGQGAAEGAVGGAIVGSLLGLLVGGALGLPLGPSAGYGAGFGGISGAGSGAAANAEELTRRKKEATLLCLRARGYEVVY